MHFHLPGITDKVTTVVAENTKCTGGDMDIETIGYDMDSTSNPKTPSVFKKGI